MSPSIVLTPMEMLEKFAKAVRAGQSVQVITGTNKKVLTLSIWMAAEKSPRVTREAQVWHEKTGAKVMLSWPFTDPKFGKDPRVVSRGQLTQL